MFQAVVRDITLKGLGVVDHPNGKVYFVRGAWLGDVGRFQIDREDKRYGFATLVELIEPSSHRVAVACAHYGVSDRSCGGCPWLFVNYESQLLVKQKLVQDTLTRAKVLSTKSQIKAIRASPDQFAYRNRAQVKTDGASVGYIAAGTHNLVDIDSCLVLNAKVSDQLKNVKSKLPNQKWKNSKEVLDFYIYCFNHLLTGGAISLTLLW
jgi:23S rRNA (uracil1939-C5)-methyltransferase